MAQRGPRYQAMKIQDVTEMLWDHEFRLRRVEAETLEFHQAQFQELHHLRNENHWLKNMLSLKIVAGLSSMTPDITPAYFHQPTSQQVAAPSSMTPNITPAYFYQPTSQQVAGPSSMTPNITPAYFHQPTSQQYISTSSTSAGINTSSTSAGISTSSTSAGTCEEQ